MQGTIAFPARPQPTATHGNNTTVAIHRLDEFASPRSPGKGRNHRCHRRRRHHVHRCAKHSNGADAIAIAFPTRPRSTSTHRSNTTVALHRFDESAALRLPGKGGNQHYHHPFTVAAKNLHRCVCGLIICGATAFPPMTQGLQVSIHSICNHILFTSNIFSPNNNNLRQCSRDILTRRNFCIWWLDLS